MKYLLFTIILLFLMTCSQEARVETDSTDVIFNLFPAPNTVSVDSQSVEVALPDSSDTVKQYKKMKKKLEAIKKAVLKKKKTEIDSIEITQIKESKQSHITEE